MFGYHDSPSCKLDLWSPNPTRWGDNAIENRAFSPYVVHQQAVDDAIEYILRTGDTEFQTDEELTEDDLEYIRLTLQQRGFPIV